MRYFQLEKTHSFNNLFTKMSDPEQFFKLVETKLDELKVISKSTRTENEWLWNLTIAKDQTKLDEEKSQFYAKIKVEALFVKETKRCCLSFTKIGGSSFYFNDQFRKIAAALNALK